MSAPLLYVAMTQFEGESLELVGVGKTAAGAAQILDLHLAGMDAMTSGFPGPAVPDAMTSEVIDTSRPGVQLGYSLLWPVPAEKLTRGLRDLLESDDPPLPLPDLARNVERALELLRRQPLSENDRLGAINLLQRGLAGARHAIEAESVARDRVRRAALELVK